MNACLDMDYWRMHVRSRQGPFGCAPSRPRQQGLLLLEALLAVLIVAWGVLGMLSLQLHLLSETRNSTQRGQAIRMIEDLSERVKSNPSRFAVLGAYALPDWNEHSATDSPDCRLALCSADQQAVWDLDEWRRNVSISMPGALALSFLSQAEAGHEPNRRQLGVMLAWRLSERSAQAADPQYSRPLGVSEGLGNSAIACPDNMICHLSYIQP